jgi:phosphatidylglycerol:prolipoprotein diacylglycerol transferase
LKDSTGLSMGQWLCIPMILAGILLWLWASHRRLQPVPVRP